MNNEPHSWLVIGVSSNWDTSLAQPIPLWGLKNVYFESFQLMHSGDIIWIYVTTPIKGVIGVGVVKDKYIDNVSRVWPQEQQKQQVIWPLRFRIQLLKLLPRELWEDKRININDFGLNWQRGFQRLTEEQAAILSARSEGLFGVELDTGATIVGESNGPEEAPPVASPHRKMQEIIAEIGKLQHYHTELEYPIELPGQSKNLDVVWKREVAGSPTFAFEVELSSGLEKAIARLKFAYHRWNSRPRIVVPTNDFSKTQNILRMEEREFSDQTRIYEPTQIEELLEKKRDLKKAEQNLGMY